MPPRDDPTVPVLVLSDHVPMKVRLRDALEPFAPVVTVGSELELIAKLQEPARLLVVHGVGVFADARLPWRVRRDVPTFESPIVVVTTSREPAWEQANELVSSGQLEDVIRSDTERMDSLVAAWTLHGDRCRRKVEALRMAHESAPERLHPFLEELLLEDSADLSVRSWAERKPEGSRFSLRRELAREGVTPSLLLDVVRVLNAVSRVLQRSRSRLQDHLPTLPDVRSARRILNRTLGMSPSDVTNLAKTEGPDAVRERTKRAVSDMLRGTDAPQDPDADGAV